MIFSRATVREMPREGTLLPETYKFPRGTTRDQVVAAHAADAEARAGGNLGTAQPGRSGQDAGAAGDPWPRLSRRKPASRTSAAASPPCSSTGLRQKIKLQSDPTIIYGLVGGKGTLGRPIKRSEIQQPSPYNTYVVDGLPPGRSPIPDAPRWKPRPIRRAPAICSSSPTAPAATPLPKPTTSTRRTSPNCARWKSRFRTTRSNRLTIRRRPLRARRPTPVPRLRRRPRSRPRRKSPLASGAAGCGAIDASPPVVQR
jgi:UPF0755 protein